MATFEPFHINAGSTFSQGPVRFETLFSGMYVVSSPKSSEFPGTGSFAFHENGFVVITFPSLPNAATLGFDLPGTKAFIATVHVGPSSPPVNTFLDVTHKTVGIPNFSGPQEVIVRLTAAASDTPADWMLQDIIVVSQM